MKKISKMISLLLTVCMILSMLPTFAAAENTSVEDVADVSVISEPESVQTAEPVEAVPAERVSSAPTAELQDDDAAQVAAGKFIKTVAPDGTVMYYDSLASAATTASSWEETGGAMYLLADYTIYSSSNIANPLMNYSANNTYETTEGGITVQGFWFDLGGHTLTAKMAQTIIGRGAATSINIRNGRIIYQNNGRASSFVGAICFGYSTQAPAVGGKIEVGRVTLKDMELISLKHSASTFVGRCIYSTLWSNEVRVYNSKVIAEETNAVAFCKSNATVTGDALSAFRANGANNVVRLYGDSVVGSLAGTAAIHCYMTGNGTTEGINHTCTVTADLDSKFLGSAIYSSDTTYTITSDIPSMESSTYSYALPDETTIVEANTIGAKPSDLATPKEYPVFQYPEFKTDDELIAEGRFVKTISPDGITVGYNDLTAAYNAASAWTKPGGEIVLLQDYTLAYSTTPASSGVFAASTATYENNSEPGLPVKGFWIDLGGHTLTATAGRPLFYSANSAQINIKNGNLIFRNSGRSSVYFGAMTFGVTSTSPLSGSTVLRPVVNLKNVNFYTLHWANSTGEDTKVASAICCTLWSAEVNLYDSLILSEDAQAIEFYKSSKVPTAAEKETLITNGVSYDVNTYGTSVIGTLSDYVAGAVTLADVASSDSGIPFKLNITLSEPTKVLGKALYGGTLKSQVTVKGISANGELLNLGETTYELALPDGATIAKSSAMGAVPENKETTTIPAFIHTPLVENNVATFTPEGGTESAVGTFSTAFTAWKKAGYRGTIKLYDTPKKDDFVGAYRAIGGDISYSTTSTSQTMKRTNILLDSAANGGNLTLDLNGFTAASSDILFAAAKSLEGFTLTIKNGKLASSSAAILLLDGNAFGLTMDNVELEITDGDGYCVYDYRMSSSYTILRDCKMSAATSGPIYILTNATNKSDSSLLYYVKDSNLVYDNTASAAAPFACGTNSSNTYRDYTVVFDGDNTFVTTFKGSDGVPYVNGSDTKTDWNYFLGGELVKPSGTTEAPWTVTTDTSKTLLTTEDAAVATVTVADMTFGFKDAVEAIRCAAVFGRCFVGTTAVLKQNLTVAASETIGNEKFATAFVVDLNGNTLTGNGTDPIFTLKGDADITLCNGAVKNGEAVVLAGAETYTYENCSVNSDLAYVRVSNKEFDAAVATYTTATQSETIYFASAADAVGYSQTDRDATADKGGEIKLLADFAADASFGYQADETCAIRLDKNAKAINLDLNEHSFKIPGSFVIGSDEAFTQKLSVSVKNGIWEQTKPGAAAFRIEGNAPLFNMELNGVTLFSAGTGVAYYAAADSAENLLVIADSTVVARNNGIETLNGEMTGRIGGRLIVADSAIAAVNNNSGYAIVDGVASAGEATHILLVGKNIALYSAKIGNKPVKISEEDGDVCVAPDYKVILEEPQALRFADDKVKEDNYLSETLGGNDYDALTRWTPNTLASYFTGGVLSFYSTVADLKAAYAADEVGGGTLTLLADVTFPETFVVDKDLTIVLDGFKFNVDGGNAILVEAGKSLTVSDGSVYSGKTAIVNKGTLTLDNVVLNGSNALQNTGDAATANLTDCALYALGADGFALKADGTAGASVTLGGSILAAPYASAALQIASDNTVEFLTDPVIYAKQGNETVGYTVAENGKLIVPGDLIIAMLSKKTSLDIDTTIYTVSEFGFAMVSVTFKQDNAKIYEDKIYSGTAPTYDVKPEKTSVNNITYVFTGWKIEGDETLYQIGDLPILTEDTVFTAVFDETNHIATVSLNNEISFYDDLDTAFKAIQKGAILTLWRSLTLDEPISILKSNFTFDLGGFTITVPEAPYAIALNSNNVTLQNGKIVSTGKAVSINGSNGCVLQDLQIQAALNAIYVDGGDVTVNNTVAVGGSEALYAQNAANVTASSSEFYSIDSYALTAKGAGTMVLLGGANKFGSVKDSQLTLQITGGATVKTDTDTFYVTQGLRESGKWYDCDKQSSFTLQVTAIERTPTAVPITNDATGYQSTVDFYAVNSATAAATVNGVTYGTLAEALEAAGKLDGATVTFLRDIKAEDEKVYTYRFTKDMTIDLNGFALIDRVSHAEDSMNAFIYFTAGRTVTFQNGTIIAPNTSKTSGGSNVYNIFVAAGGMTLRMVNMNIFSKNAGIYCSSSQQNFHLELVGGLIANYGSNYPIHLNFSGEGKEASTKISGGTILVASGDRVVIAQSGATRNTLNLEDVYVYSTDNKPIPEAAPMEGTVFPKPILLDGAANPKEWLTERFADLLEKYGSVLNFDVIAESSKLMHYISSEGVAEVGEETYGSVADALASAASAPGDVTIKLMKDATEYGLSTIPANAVLDLDGKTLSFDGNADMKVLGEIKLNGGKLVSNGNVLFKAGSVDLSGEIVAADYRLDQRLMPDKISLTLNDGVTVNYKINGTDLSLGDMKMNGEDVVITKTRTQTVFSHTFDFDSFNAKIELTATDSSGVPHRSGYMTGIKTFADAVAADGTATAAFKTAMTALSTFGGTLGAAHDWQKAKDFTNIAGCAVYVDPGRAFDLRFTGAIGDKLTVTYTDSTCGSQVEKEITISDEGDAIYTGLYTACLSDTLTISCNGESETVKYADLVKDVLGENALYTNMIAYSNAANALFKS